MDWPGLSVGRFYDFYRALGAYAYVYLFVDDLLLLVFKVIAQLDDESNLKDILYVCPLSVEDLTVRSETAVHVALKNGSLKAFKFLLGWLQYFKKEEILNWEDEEGNNALHTAVSANQPEAVKLLIGCMKVNKKNGKGLTALDIFNDRQGQDLVDAAVRDILLAAKAKSASQLHCPSLRGSEEASLFKNSSRGLSFSAKEFRKALVWVTEALIKFHLKSEMFYLWWLY
ncbi:ankyrin repeat-containing protein BDA1-like [Mangifera indica]|uniref:ankyrin repeat-containing protein BDA1-like n=1 Tax=Mangifera indica TaxID=29780 RepID=UPI001CFBB4F9|nr:ankyrin repeat-containing protein BDA1-like [Mangifera indica]